MCNQLVSRLRVRVRALLAALLILPTALFSILPAYLCSTSLPLFERYIRFPCSVLRFATSATLHQGRSERVSASDVAGVTAAAHDCFRIVIINFSFISLGLSCQAPPPSPPLGHLLQQPDRPSASCSSASKYESPFVVPCSGCLSSSRAAAVAMHLISSVHVVDFASPSKCLPCTPVLAQRLSLSAT